MAVEKGFKHKKVTKRFQTESVLSLLKKDWQSTNEILQSSIDSGGYSSFNTIKGHLDKLIESKQAEYEKRGKTMFWRLSNIYIKEPKFGGKIK